MSTSETSAIDIRQLIAPDGGTERVDSVEQAYAWCRRLATEHYENFPVASFLVPAPMRRHMSSVYALARLGDDIGDEPWTNDPQERLDALAFLDDAVDGTVDTAGHPVFMALRQTMADCALPPTLFHRLFEAFRRDVQFQPPSTWDDILDYCHYSANPVGELVLRIAGDATPAAIEHSNAICTALQVTNFLQDQSRDAAMGRTYMVLSPAEMVARTEELYGKGAGVARHLRSWRMRTEIRAIVISGRRMLHRCNAQLDELSTTRPALGPIDYLWIVARLIAGCRL